MTNKISDDKRHVHLVLDRKLVAMIDNECARTGLNRTETITRAVREHLRLDPIPASAAQLDEVKNALVALGQKQDALAAAQLSQRQPSHLPTEPRRLTLGERLRGRLD